MSCLEMQLLRTTYHWDPPCEASEDTGGDQHNDEDNP
jgi:hypothetical protein